MLVGLYTVDSSLVSSSGGTTLASMVLLDSANNVKWSKTFKASTTNDEFLNSKNVFDPGTESKILHASSLGVSTSSKR